MRKALLIILCVVSVFCSTACEKDSRKELVDDAVRELKSEWTDIYNRKLGNIEYNGYFEIKNTRVIEIGDTDIELFKDIDYIVEFVLFTDYFGSAPYYSSIGISDTVVVYSDGAMEVPNTNLLTAYRSRYYTVDFSDIIKKVNDCKDKYNCVEYLKIED